MLVGGPEDMPHLPIRGKWSKYLRWEILSVLLPVCSEASFSNLLDALITKTDDHLFHRKIRPKERAPKPVLLDKPQSLPPAEITKRPRPMSQGLAQYIWWRGQDCRPRWHLQEYFLLPHSRPQSLHYLRYSPPAESCNWPQSIPFYQFWLV